MAVKEEFIKSLDYLTGIKGVTQVAIAKAIDVHPSKLRNIKAGRSSGNQEMLDKLIAAYPELKGKTTLLTPVEEKIVAIEKRIEKLEEELAQREKKLFEENKWLRDLVDELRKERNNPSN